MGIYLVLLIYIFKKLKMVNFMLCIFYLKKNSKKEGV